VAETILDQIVGNNLCVGCGMCAGVYADTFSMYTDKYGAYLPQLIGDGDSLKEQSSMKVCPFADNVHNEDSIALRDYGHQEFIKHSDKIGYYLECFAGYVNDDQFRIESSSGGIITWIADSMLVSGEIDKIACVGKSDKKDCLFEYKLISNRESLYECRKSRYYPVEVSGIISEIKKSESKVLFIGLPCFIKALKLAMNTDHELRDRISYTISLFCGHLKTKHYSAYLSRCCGVKENNIESVDFRKKISGKPANSYAFEVTTSNGKQKESRRLMMRDIFTGSWGNNVFMLDACEYCDDVVGETADISAGDAWLPEYVKDYRGTNLVICRNKYISSLLENGVREGKISLDKITDDKVIEAQAGCFRQRRDGLKYRLYLSAKKGIWRPKKRVGPDYSAIGFFDRLLQLLRIKSKAVSKEAFLEQQLSDKTDVFVKRLQPWIRMIKIVNFVRHLTFKVTKRCF